MKLALLPLTLLLALGCHRVVIHHGGDHDQKTTSSSTVNRSIELAPGTKLSEGCSSVNGGVRLGDGCSTRKVSTVNGSIRIGADCTIERDCSSVNGSVSSGPQTRIQGGVDTVNGSIKLVQTQVGGDLSTVNGTIDLRGTKVAGDIVIRGRASGWFSSFSNRPLVITLREGAEVQGQVRVKDSARNVEVRVDGSSQVKGGVGSASLVKL